MAKDRLKDIYAAAEQDKDLSTIGGRIRYARISRGLTQQEVADALPDIPGRKKSRASIAQYETGSPPGLDVITDLAAILQENPCYLAFGGGGAGLVPAPRGERVPVVPVGAERDEVYAFLPTPLLNELGAGDGKLALVRLSVDAPAFGMRRGDYLLVDAGAAGRQADGHLYAVATSNGVVVARAEPALTQDNDDVINLISGHGIQYSVKAASVEFAGRVVASLQRPF